MFRRQLKFVSVGDSSRDRNAALKCESVIAKDHIRFVKFERTSSTETLVLQINRFRLMLGDMVNCQHHLDIEKMNQLHLRNEMINNNSVEKLVYDAQIP